MQITIINIYNAIGRQRPKLVSLQAWGEEVDIVEVDHAPSQSHSTWAPTDSMWRIKLQDSTNGSGMLRGSPPNLHIPTFT